ncbi:MAG: DUF4340 domain-containing protein, partial [Porticoccus sp.]|nr:DUF4340 domain-containing protein [Porticoccus sp.]
NQPKPLLSIDWQAVDSLSIEDKASGVYMARSEGQWMLSKQQLPASNDKVNELLQNLEKLHTSWPVATTSNSHKRFQVAEDKFIRRVQLYSDGEVLAELFFGNSPGLRQSHVRRKGDDSIYIVDIDTLEMLPSSKPWFDTALLAVKDAQIIKGPDYNIKKAGTYWTFNRTGPSIFLGNTKQGKLNQENVERLDKALADLVIQRVASNFQPDYQAAETLDVKLVVSDAKNSWTYHFVRDEGRHYVRRSDRDLFFAMNKSVFDPIASIRQVDLIFNKTEPPITLTEGLKEAIAE